MCTATPGKIITITETWLDNEPSVGFVELGREGGPRIKVNLLLVPDAKVNDWVLVHTGTAIQLIDPKEADAIMKAIDELAKVAA